MRWSFVFATYMNSCGVTSNNEQVCADALTHLGDCTGLYPTAPECIGDAVDESELILSLECSELDQALDALPLCETLGTS